MNLLKRIGNAIGGIASRYTYMYTAVKWLWPDDNKNVYIEHGYKELPNLYSIIDIILQKSKIVPFDVYKVKSKSKFNKYKAMMNSAKTPNDLARAIVMKNLSMEAVEGSEIEALLLNPNPQQTTAELFEQLDGYKLLTGNTYLWGWVPGVGVNAKKPQQLHVPPATMVTVVTGTLDQPVTEYKIDYIEEHIPADEILHIKNWKPLTSFNNFDDSVYGMSPLISSRRLLQRYKDADIAQGTMFKNMAPAGILAGEKGSETNEEQAIAIKDRFKQLYGGADKAGEIIVTSAAMKWQQIGLSPVDLKILEAKEEMLNELCNIYHVPIGMFTKVNSTENNMVESRKMLITDAVIPLVEARKAALNKWLAPKFDDNIVIEFDYTVFSEISQELQALVTTAKDMYWITPNEKRAMTNYDQDPMPEMNRYYFPSNLMPLDMIGADPGIIDVDPLLDLEEDA